MSIFYAKNNYINILFTNLYKIILSASYMEHFYESFLVSTSDGLQCKVYSNNHPDGKIIVKPKYVPDDKINLVGLKKRFVFSKSMFRFNLFNDMNIVNENLKEFKKVYPDYIYNSELHNNWFFVVPKDKIERVYDPKIGLKELMKIPESDLDDYLKSVTQLIKLILDSGVSLDDLGINHSTLLGNYTPGKSDIDIVIYGKKNGWKVVEYMKNIVHPQIRWKSEEDWARYYTDRVVSKIYSKDEYVSNMVRKKDDGFFNNNVFSLFCVEEPNEVWYNWEDKHEPLATVKLTPKIKNNYNSIVRPGYYEIKDSKIIEGYENVDIKRIVFYSRDYISQADVGEKIKACGLLEKVTPQSGESYHRLVIGYFDSAISPRRDKEYIKVLI